MTQRTQQTQFPRYLPTGVQVGFLIIQDGSNKDPGKFFRQCIIVLFLRLLLVVAAGFILSTLIKGCKFLQLFSYGKCWNLIATFLVQDIIVKVGGFPTANAMLLALVLGLDGCLELPAKACSTYTHHTITSILSFNNYLAIIALLAIVHSQPRQEARIRQPQSARGRLPFLRTVRSTQTLFHGSVRDWS